MTAPAGSALAFATDATQGSPAGHSPGAAPALLAVRQLRLTDFRNYRQIRLDRARDLLRQSAVPITEIALGCGFSSASHFSRAYREAFGVTPASERRA